MSELQLSELGKIIEQRRLELRLTKTDLMRATRISPNTYYRMISEDIGYISLKTMTTMARALGMSLSAMLKHDPAYGTKRDYYYNRLSLARALDTYVDARLQDMNAPMLVPVYGRVFLALMFELYKKGEEYESLLPIPHEVAAKPGVKFAIQVTPRIGGQTALKQTPKYAVLSFSQQNNIKLGIEDGRLLALTDQAKFDRIGHCYWDDGRGVVRIERIMHGDEPYELEYAKISYICDVLELIYI